MARPSGRDIRSAAIEAASAAIKSKGVTGFSYGDVAGRIGVRAPSIHHHFRLKQDLVAETAAQYRQTFRRSVAGIDDPRALDRLRSYSIHFLRPAGEADLCLCGAAVAGWDDLNDEARAEIAGFFEDEIAWVEGQLAAAVDEGDLRPDLEVGPFAVSFVAALEGALLLARSQQSSWSPLTIPTALLDMAASRA